MVSNTTYQVGIWAIGTGKMTLRIYSGSTSLYAGIVTPCPSWTYYSYPFATGTNTQLTVKFDDESTVAGAVSVDDVFMGVSGSTNVLTNPSFESGTTGWNMASSGITWSVLNTGTAGSGNEYDGYESARAVFSGTATYARITQTAPVVSNTTYTFGAWIKGGGRTTLRVYQGSTCLAVQIVSPTTDWN